MHGAPPLVSVGIPLYRSERFLDVVVENIEAIAYPNVEIIVSDRHMLDDALVRLEQRYAADARFRFVVGRDALGWVDHFNLLLRTARGRYFLWMFHDDSYPAHYIGDLVAALEARPDAVLAFGRVEQVSLDGFLPVFPFVPPPVAPDAPWSLGTSLRMLTLWHLWVAFRGVVRRDVVERSNLWIRPTHGTVRADVYWVFGVSLRGRLVFVPSCQCTKRFHRGSAGAAWRFGIRQSLDACRVVGSYLDDFAPSRREALLGRLVAYPWCLSQGVLPASVARRLGVLTRRVGLAAALRTPR